MSVGWGQDCTGCNYNFEPIYSMGIDSSFCESEIINFSSGVIINGFADKKYSCKYQIYYCWFHVNKNRIIKI